MISLLWAAVVYSANQGSAVQVKIPNEPGVRSVHVIWQKKDVPAVHAGDAWTTILGVDLDAAPGEHTAEAVMTMDTGRAETREIAVNVVAKTFPTSRLNVEEKFVELSKADVERSEREAREIDAIYERITTDIVP